MTTRAKSRGRTQSPSDADRQSDPGGLHTDPRLDHLLGARADDVTALPFERRDRDQIADPHVPEELAADVMTILLRGGGSLAEDEEEAEGLEGHLDRDGIAAGIVPQMVSQASLCGLEEEEEEEE